MIRNTTTTNVTIDEMIDVLLGADNITVTYSIPQLYGTSCKYDSCEMIWDNLLHFKSNDSSTNIMINHDDRIELTIQSITIKTPVDTNISTTYKYRLPNNILIDVAVVSVVPKAV